VRQMWEASGAEFTTRDSTKKFCVSFPIGCSD
jgi:hypothetical protein